MQYWLMKSEPATYSINDLAKKPQQTDLWEGVRNYQARNMLRDQMQLNDQAFFYHSSCAEPGIVGIVKIVCAGYPDPTQYQADSKYYDPKSSLENPIWYTVDIKLLKKFKKLISLQFIKETPALSQMQLVKRGNRLSIMPVTLAEWQIINNIVT